MYMFTRVLLAIYTNVFCRGLFRNMVKGQHRAEDNGQNI